LIPRSEEQWLLKNHICFETRAKKWPE